MPPPVLQKLFQLPSKPAAVVVSLALVLLSAVMTLFLSTSVTDQLGDIARNYALRQEVDKVARLAGNIEMSRRGYLLTLDQSYLDLYRNSILDVGKTLSGLEVLTSGNPQQDARVKQIRALVEREEEDVRATVDLAQAGKVDAAMQKLRGDEGRVLMDQLSATVTQFINVEEQQLALRNARIDRMRYRITATSIVALISAVVLGLLLFTRVQRYARTLFEGQTALRSANELLEQRVRARTAELEEERRIAERERARVELLLQDTNHRIGNSLATVSSLLGLQMRQTASEDARAALAAARDRVQTVSTAHRRLRLGEDMDTARVDDFLDAVVNDIRTAVGQDRHIEFTTDFAPLDLKARDVTTIGIVVGELVTNAIKHAFKGQTEGRIAVRFKPDGENVPVLTVEDDGIGWNGAGPGRDEKAGNQKGKGGKSASAHTAGNANSNAHSGRNGLGMLVVEQLCMQFGEKPVYGAAEHGSGTCVTVRLPSLAPATQDAEAVAEAGVAE